MLRSKKWETRCMSGSIRFSGRACNCVCGITSEVIRHFCLEKTFFPLYPYNMIAAAVKDSLYVIALFCLRVRGVKPIWTSSCRQYCWPLDSATPRSVARAALLRMDDSSCGARVASSSLGFIYMGALPA